MDDHDHNDHQYHALEPKDARSSTDADLRSRQGGCSPFVITIFFTIVNVLNYFDRGATGAMLSNIQDSFDLSNTQAGFLNSAFMCGFVIFSPLFAQLAHHYDPMYLMAVGLAIWSASTIVAGCSIAYWMLVLGRMFCGAGEASFVCLVPPFIDDYAPPTQRSKWLAMFYLAIPVGGAMGFIIAGPVATHTSWRYPFIAEGCLMFPFIMFSALVPRLINRHKNPGVDHATRGNCEINDHTVTKEPEPFLPILVRLLENPVFVTTTLGYTAFTFVIGGLTVWFVHYLEDEPHFVDPDQATTTFGGLSVLGGIMGTMFGGWLVDHTGGSTGQQGTVRALRICAIFSLASMPFMFGAFVVGPIGGVYPLIFVAEFLLWTTTSPINGALMSMVLPPDRPMSMAVSVFAIHLLGDTPSSTLIGVIKDGIGNWTTTMLLVSAYLALTPLFWFWAWWLAKSPNHSYIYKSDDSDVTNAVQGVPGIAVTDTMLGLHRHSTDTAAGAMTSLNTIANGSNDPSHNAKDGDGADGDGVGDVGRTKHAHSQSKLQQSVFASAESNRSD